jgi:UDP-N-acetylmuramoyl-L-alanyl-D-glutamate--2,6-diaminopimelate ligase
MAAAHALGIAPHAAAEALASAQRVPGRFEPVDEGQDFGVLVDYAHTPDSLGNVLASARGLLDEGRLIVVFGAGGDRDRDKRPLMGQVARELADSIVLTNDNPRSEEPIAIVEAILQGTGTDVEIDLDRRSAIESAIAGASAGDVVVIAGKGHEQGQEIAGAVHPFDDRDVARAALRARGVARE